jgi:hypothetical protein
MRMMAARSDNARWLSPGEILLTAVLALLVVLYSFIYVRLLDDPSMYGTDFISFYTAGRIARQGDLHHLFDLEAQRSIQEPIVGAGAFTGGSNLSQHPPYLAPLLACLALNDFILSFILWTLVRLACLVACGVIIYRFLQAEGINLRPSLWIALSAVTFFPLFLSLLSGQDTVWILLGLLVWMSALMRQREVQAGLGLAFASLNPTIAGALALPLMVTRRKAALWFLVGMVVLGLYSLLLIGFEGARDLFSLLALSAGGSEYGLNPSAMYNLLGLLLRTFPNLPLATARQISWIVFLISLVSMMALWWNKRYALRLEHIGLAVVLAVFTSPHLHVHSLTFLILPALVICVLFYKHHRQSLALALIPATSLLFMITAFYSSTWNHLVVYLWMLLAAILFIGCLKNS